jgi:hypothetical protein
MVMALFVLMVSVSIKYNPGDTSHLPSNPGQLFVDSVPTSELGEGLGEV